MQQIYFIYFKVCVVKAYKDNEVIYEGIALLT